ncbi:MAG TPA: hypothetical protein VE715_20205 [Blastocatellia bacterium]|nr:hypothetical protein [Blastocatellia bacterium]
MFTTRANRATGRTGKACICRINEDHGNTRLFGFVCDFGSQIVESPTAKHFAHSLAFRGSLTNAGQVFERNRNVIGFGFRNDFLTDYVINIFHHARLLAAQAFQGAPGALCPFGLQARSCALPHFTQSVQIATGDCFPGRKSSDAIDSQVNAERIIRIAFRRLRNINHEMNVKSLFLFIVNQMSRCRFLAFQQMSLVVAQLKFDLLTALNCRNRNRLVERNEADQVFVQIKASRLEFFRRLFLAEGLGNTSNSPDNVIGCQAGRGFDVAITQAMNIKGSLDAVGLGDPQRLITSAGKYFKRGLERFRLNLTWNQFCRYSPLHW